MKLLLKILFSIFVIITTVEETKSFAVVNSLHLVNSTYWSPPAEVLGHQSQHARIMSNAFVKSIHGAQSSFWNAAPTRAVTTVLTSMIGGGFISGYKWAYSAIKGVRATNTAMTDVQLLTRAAQKAEAAIGGTGRFAGTVKHTYARNLIGRYQSIYGDRGLSVGSNYFKGPTGRGFLDVVNHRTMTIYDFKFGNAIMNNSQFLKYSTSFPRYTIRIIRP